MENPSYNNTTFLHHGRPLNGENRPLKRNQTTLIGESVRVTRFLERVARARIGETEKVKAGAKEQGNGCIIGGRKVWSTTSAFDSTTRCAVCLRDPPRRIRQRMRDFDYSAFCFRFSFLFFFSVLVGYGVVSNDDVESGPAYSATSASSKPSQCIGLRRDVL